MQIEGANGIKLDVVIENRTFTPNSNFVKDGKVPNLQTNKSVEETKGIPKPEEFRMGNFDAMAQLGAHMGAINASWSNWTPKNTPS